MLASGRTDEPEDVGSMGRGVQGLFITASKTRTSTRLSSEKDAEDSYSFQALQKQSSPRESHQTELLTLSPKCKTACGQWRPERPKNVIDTLVIFLMSQKKNISIVSSYVST